MEFDIFFDISTGNYENIKKIHIDRIAYSDFNNCYTCKPAFAKFETC